MADGFTISDLKASLLNTLEKVFDLVTTIVALFKMFK